jgi:hypothetical protein
MNDEESSLVHYTWNSTHSTILITLFALVLFSIEISCFITFNLPKLSIVLNLVHLVQGIYFILYGRSFHINYLHKQSLLVTGI